jgi:hypothetical protein
MEEPDEYTIQKERDHDSGHTIRKFVGGPCAHSERTVRNRGRYSIHRCAPFDETREERVHLPTQVRDYQHVPITKTWSVKLWEHKSGRQWLNRRRRYENHVDRANRESKLRQDVKELD